MPSHLRAALFFGGFFCFIWAYLWTCHRGFSKSPLDGILCLFFPPYALIFAIIHRRTMRPIIIFYVLGIVAVGLVSLPL